MKYDHRILLEAAQRFNDRASWIVFWCSAKYTVVGFIVGFFVAAVLSRLYPDQVTTPGWFGGAAVGVAGLLTGVGVGTARAFDLRVEAQRLMALVQIERNTKSTPTAVANE